MQSPVFRWGEVEGEVFSQAIQESYKEVVHWRRNLFKTPSGQAGKSLCASLLECFKLMLIYCHLRVWL